MRIAGVNMPGKKHVVIALTKIYGIGNATARQVCKNAGVDYEKIIDNLTGDDLDRLLAEISKLTVEGDLRREVQSNIKRMMDTGSYRGLRHRRGLPVRGQRTHTNARTRKGRKSKVKAS